MPQRSDSTEPEASSNANASLAPVGQVLNAGEYLQGIAAGIEIARQEVIFQQDVVLQGLVPAFDLALCLRVIWRSANMIHVLAFHPLSELANWRHYRTAIEADE